ncbi:MAG: DMT family transporter [Opitutaceae bacterium]
MPSTVPSHDSDVSTQRRGVLFMLLSVVCFTSNVLLIRALGSVESVSVWLVSCVRFVVGLGLISAFFWNEWRPLQLVRSRKLIERGLVGGVSVYGYYLTVVELGAGRATFINNTYVVIGGCLAVLLLGERLRALLLVGGLVSLAGLALLTDVLATGGGPGRYDLLAVLVAFSSAWVVITIRQLHAAGEHTATIFSAQCAYGLVACLVPAILTFAQPSWTAWMLMILAAICAGIGQIAMTRAFAVLAVGRGSLLQMLVPLGVACGGVVFFREHFHPAEVVGGLLIVVGTAMPAWRPSPPREAVT